MSNPHDPHPGWQPPADPQPSAYGAPAQPPGVPAFGTSQGPYAHPTPVAQVEGNRTGGARIVAAIFGTVVGRALIVAAVVGGIALYHYATNDSAHRDDSGNVSQAGSLGIDQLKPGDCFNAPSSESDIESITAIPCDQAHDSQVFTDVPIAENTFPAAATLDKEGEDGCGTYADTALSSSPPGDVQINYYVPQDASTFDNGIDYIVCAIQAPGKDLTQSYVRGH